MSEEKKIEQLLAAFYNGDTTPEEEEFLMKFFNNADLNEKWHTDRALFHVLYDPSRISLPKGLSERLERTIDSHMAATIDHPFVPKTTGRKSTSKTRRLFISMSSAAAVAILCIGLFFTFDKTSKSDFIADTYTNPEEAAIVAEQTLLFISAKLNQGLHPLEKVKENIHKTNELINEHLKLN
jgi:hypothetical protein